MKGEHEIIEYLKKTPGLVVYLAAVRAGCLLLAPRRITMSGASTATESARPCWSVFMMCLSPPGGRAENRCAVELKPTYGFLIVEIGRPRDMRGRREEAGWSDTGR
jgi:hypothetical protein